MRLSYFDGQYVPTDQLSIPVMDDIIGFVRGYRIFTACRTVNRDFIFHEADHIERLFDAAGQIHMTLPLDRGELSTLLHHEVVQKNLDPAGDVLLEIVFTGGPAAPNGVAPAGPAKLMVMVFDLKLPPDRWYEEGVALASYVHQRPFATVKSMFYMGAVMAHQTVVLEQKADEGLFIDPVDGETVLEGTTFNVFLVRSNNEIWTTPLDGRVLKGITRGVVLDVIRRETGYQVVEKPFTLNEMKAAKGAFLTSSTRNVVPITRMDETLIGDGKPEGVTLEILGKVRGYQESYQSQV